VQLVLRKAVDAAFNLKTVIVMSIRQTAPALGSAYFKELS